MPRALPDLLPRALSALALGGAAVLSVWAGGAVFDLIWLCAALAVALEWQSIVPAARPQLRYLCAGLGMAASACFASTGWPGAAVVVLLACGLLLALAAGPRYQMWAAGGIAYAGALVLSLAALHGSPDYGGRAIVWLFAIVWGTDVFAYFGGRLIGGPKLWPHISPGKTWSGTLTGIFAGAILGVAAASIGLSPPPQIIPIFFLGLVAAALSQAGDIFESSFKRRFGVKDSSRLIPGHGGFMDRLDAFIAAACFAALIGAVRGGPTVAAGLLNWY